jgi:hypothetical protein
VLSTRPVTTHVDRGMRKLQMNGRAAIAAVALDAGPMGCRVSRRRRRRTRGKDGAVSGDRRRCVSSPCAARRVGRTRKAHRGGLGHRANQSTRGIYFPGTSTSPRLDTWRIKRQRSRPQFGKWAFMHSSAPKTVETMGANDPARCYNVFRFCPSNADRALNYLRFVTALHDENSGHRSHRLVV